MTTLILDGHIELLQPFTVNVPHKEALNPHLHLTPIFDATGTRSLPPAIPGSNIKGALRSVGGMAALAEIYGADPADPLTWGVFTIDQVYNAQSGGLVLKAQTKAEDLVRARQNRERDNHSSLFGSMRLAMKGLLEVDFAIPDLATYGEKGLRGRHFGARRDPYMREPDLLNRHSDDQVKAFVEAQDDKKALSGLRKREKAIEAELRKLAPGNRKKGEEDGESADVRRLREELAQVAAEKEVLQKGGAEAIGRTLDPREYMPQGMRLTHGMRVVNASDVTIGYFLRVLAHFSNNCRLGGLASTGFGRVKLDYSLRVRNGIRTEEAGRLVVSPYEFDLDSQHPAILRAMAAFDEAAKEPEKFFSLDLGAKPARKAVAEAPEEVA